MVGRKWRFFITAEPHTKKEAEKSQLVGNVANGLIVSANARPIRESKLPTNLLVATLDC